MAADSSTFDNSIAIRLSNGIEVPFIDEREHKGFVLENGARAIVVSDPAADKAGVGVTVDVGSFADPEDIPGLAHFLEHMLFMGTEKYPDENEWSQWLNEHGGSSNAFTASENTTYYFDIQSSALLAALDRFAQFFVAPTMKADCVARELQAVDSEHAKNLNNDAWRALQLDRSTADPAHPYSKFSTGDSTTLRDVPASKGIDVRAALLRFYDEHYIASRTTIAVIGRESVGELEARVRECFAGLRPSPADPAAAAPAPVSPTPFNLAAGVSVQRMVPLQEERLIDLTWVLPPSRLTWRTKPDRIATQLLGHEGRGSLCAFLKRKGWALELYAGGMSSFSSFDLFGVTVKLTEAGLRAWEQVVAASFAYLRMVDAAGPQRRIFDEEATVAASVFRFTQPGSPGNEVISLSGDLRKYPVENVRSATSLFQQYDPEATAAIFAILKDPANVRIRIRGKELEPLCTEREKWYGTAYAETFATEAQLAEWRGDAGTEYQRTPPTLHLPPPNPFLATDFELRAGPVPGYRLAGARIGGDEEDEDDDEDDEDDEDEDDGDEDGEKGDGKGEAREEGSAAAGGGSTVAAPETAIEDGLLLPVKEGSEAAPEGKKRIVQPRILRDDERALVFHHLDDWFGEPKIVIRAQVFAPCAVATTPLAFVVADLYVRMLTESLNELTYDASLARLSYSVNSGARSLILSVTGFNHKAGVLLATLLRFMQNLHRPKAGASDSAAAAAAAGGVEGAAGGGEGAATDDEAALYGFTDEEFERKRADLEEQLVSFTVGQPYSHATSEGDAAIRDQVWTYRERLEVLRSPALLGTAGAQRVRAFAQTLFTEGAFIRALIGGNVSESEARDLGDILTAPFAKGAPFANPLLGLAPFSSAVVALPTTVALRVHRKGPNPRDDNAACEVNLHVGTDAVEDLVRGELLAQLLRDSAFDQLRTKETLGYIVFAGLRELPNFTSLRVIVQSNRLNASGIEGRIESFLHNFRAKIAALPLRSLRKHAAAVAKRYQEVEKRSVAELSRLWDEIVGDTFHFDAPRKAVLYLRTLRRSDLLRLYDDLVAPGGRRRRKLAILIDAGGNQTQLADPVAAGHPAVPEGALGVTHPDPAEAFGRLIEGTLDAPNGVIEVDDPISVRASLPRAPIAAFSNLLRWKKSLEAK